jgi:hypothetical protein
MTVADFSLEGALFINQCLVLDPQSRMSISDMINHTYLKDKTPKHIPGERVGEEIDAKAIKSFRENPDKWISKNKEMVCELNFKELELNANTLLNAANACKKQASKIAGE